MIIARTKSLSQAIHNLWHFKQSNQLNAFHAGSKKWGLNSELPGDYKKMLAELPDDELAKVLITGYNHRDK